MARIVLIGGHGKVALLTHPLLIADGHEVDAIIRNPDHAADVEAKGARPVIADVASLDVDGLADLLRGHDVVVWSAGAGGGSPERTYAVDRDAAIRSMDAAAQAQVPRYVMVSYAGAGLDHGVPQDNDFYPYAQAKAEADEHLRASELDWTILGPSRLTDGPATGTLAPHGEHGEISRANVAELIRAVLAGPDVAVGHFVQVDDGDTPVAQLLADL